VHPGFAALSNGALATLRVITLQETQDAPSLWFPRFNLPVGLNTSDNMHSAGGGIASPVDLQSARLGPASGKEVLGDYQDSHPDTGTSITGFTLPGFHEAVALARKAHAAMPGLPTAGWDIAITPDGPLLVETNSGWGIETIQRVVGHPIARETGFCRRLAAILEDYLARPADDSR
jgi:hypothetical protein